MADNLKADDCSCNMNAVENTTNAKYIDEIVSLLDKFPDPPMSTDSPSQRANQPTVSSVLPFNMKSVTTTLVSIRSRLTDKWIFSANSSKK